MTAADRWTAQLDRADGLIARAHRSLADGDLDGAALAAQELADQGARAGLPSLPLALGPRARRTAAELASLEAEVAAVLTRLRPELSLLAGLPRSSRAQSLFVDQSA